MKKLLLLLAVLPSVVHGQVNSWRTLGSGFWESPGNWSLTETPSNHHAAVLITNATTKTVTISSSVPAANMTISNLLLTAPVGSTNTLLLTNAGPTTPLHIRNTFTISDRGIVVITNSVLSVDAGVFSVSGNVFLNTGTILTTNATAVFGCGFAGVGQLTVSNGTWLAQNVTVGPCAGLPGALTVAGGTSSLSSVLFVGLNANSTGAVWVTGGLLVVTSPYVGFLGVGQMTVSNGTVTAGNLVVAYNPGSAGTMTVAGGTNTVDSVMILGNSACTATGVVTITGGRLDVTNSIGSAVLEVSSGTFTLNSGTVTVDTFIMTNGCASFVRTGGTFAYGRAVLDTARDDDGDGIPNGYEQSHGLDPLNADANLDKDGDGLSNLQEYLAGTDPANNLSAFRITSITRQANDVRITWTTVGGKTNRVLVSKGDTGGGISNNFSNLSSFIIIPGVGESNTNYLDLGGATNVPARYYRVRLIP